MGGTIAASKRDAWMKSRIKHGGYLGGNELPEHYVWRTMLRRCNAPASKDYARYGALGVSVCARWTRYEHFIADMGKRPTPKHELDRYPDAFGNYEPTNCRWATRSQNQLNKRSTKRWVSEDGRIGTLIEWARILGISKALASYRMKHWGTFCRGEVWQLQKIK